MFPGKPYITQTPIVPLHMKSVGVRSHPNRCLSPPKTKLLRSHNCDRMSQFHRIMNERKTTAIQLIDLKAGGISRSVQRLQNVAEIDRGQTIKILDDRSRQHPILPFQSPRLPPLMRPTSTAPAPACPRYSEPFWRTVPRGATCSRNVATACAGIPTACLPVPTGFPLQTHRYRA